MKQIDALAKSPEHITDISVLADALYTLEKLEEKNGTPYVFEYIQQPMMGGTCHPVPRSLPSNEKTASRVIAVFDKAYFMKRLEENYLH